MSRPGVAENAEFEDLLAGLERGQGLDAAAASTESPELAVSLCVCDRVSGCVGVWVCVIVWVLTCACSCASFFCGQVWVDMWVWFCVCVATIPPRHFSGLLRYYVCVVCAHVRVVILLSILYSGLLCMICV